MGNKNAGIIFIAIVLIFAVAFTMGFYMGKSISPKTVSSSKKPYQVTKDMADTFESGWEAAKMKLDESGLFPQRGQGMTNLSGIVTSVSGNSFEMTSNYQPRNPLADVPPQTRTVLVTAQTQIVKRTAKSIEQLEEERTAFEKEMDAQRDAMRDGSKPKDIARLTPPERYLETNIDLNQIMQNQTVSVQADGDIEYADNITAVKIIVTEENNGGSVNGRRVPSAPPAAPEM